MLWNKNDKTILECKRICVTEKKQIRKYQMHKSNVHTDSQLCVQNNESFYEEKVQDGITENN